MKVRVCATLVVLCLIVSVSIARADVILFHDAGEIASVTYTQTNHQLTDSVGNYYNTPNFTPCVKLVGGELCGVDIFGTSTAPDFGTGVNLYIQEPGKNLISDVVIGQDVQTNAYTLTFVSFDDPYFHCPSYGCFQVESGQVQTLYTVRWGDGSLDTIQYQSEVPEPASLLLFASGMTGFLALCRRRRG